MLTLLPTIGYKYKKTPWREYIVNESMDLDIKVFLLKCLLDALRENAGFQIPKVFTSSCESSDMISTFFRTYLNKCFNISY